MHRQRVYQPQQNPQHLVRFRWHEGTRSVVTFYGPFDNVADATGFEQTFAREHPGVIDDSQIEDVIPVDQMDNFVA